MTSPVDICNRALSEMGARANITSFDEPSIAAQTCALWYDKLRKQLLQAGPWGFARGQIILTQLGDAADGTGIYPYLFKYAYPAQCLTLRYILTPPPYGSSPGPGWYKPSRLSRFQVAIDTDAEGNQTKVIISNVQAAIGVFTQDITNCDLFDDLFEGALQAALSYRLVIPLSGNIGMRNEFRQLVKQALDTAMASDANDSITTTDHVPDWIATRGIGPAFGGYGSCGSDWGQWYNPGENMNWGE